MAKLFKILGIIVGLFLLLIIAASIIVPMLVDPNDFKDEIVKQVKEQTGRDLKIAGDLDLSVFPWLGVKIGGVELSNAKGFGDKPFVAVKQAAVRVKMKPLLDKRLEVDTIGLDGVVLNLAKNKQGASNWDDLAKSHEAKPAKEEKEKHESREIGLEAFTIGGIEIKDALVSWDDRQTGQHYKISGFNLTSGAIVPGSPVGLDMSMLMESKQPAVKARLGLAGTVFLDEVKKLLSIQDLKLSLDADGAALPNGKLKAELAAAVAAALDGKSLTVQNLKLNSGALNLTGNIKGSNLNAASPVFSGQLSLAEFNPREWMASQGMEAPAMADPKALSRFAASFNLSSKGSATNLNNLRVRLDDTNVTGNAIMRGPAAAFKLNVDAIDLDRYMAAGQGAKAPSKGKQSSGKEQLFPVSTLRGLNLNGSMNIGRLTVNKMLAQKIALTVKAKNGLIQTTQKIGAFHKGSYSGKFDLNVKGKTPRIQQSSNLSKVHMGSLIAKLAGEDRLTGQGHFSTGLSASGNSVDALKRTLNGKMNFKFLNGAIKGINLASELRRARALLSGKPASSSSGPVQTDFSQITGSAVVKNGVARNNDFRFMSPFLRVNGKGTVNLVRESLDYTTEVFVVETSKGQGGHDLAMLEELKRKKIGVPVRFKGPLSKPKWEVQWQKVLVEMKKEELKSKLQDKLLGKKKKSGSKGSAKDQLKEQLLKKLF